MKVERPILAQHCRYTGTQMSLVISGVTENDQVHQIITVLLMRAYTR